MPRDTAVLRSWSAYRLGWRAVVSRPSRAHAQIGMHGL